jgi:hypothetical protein
MIVPHKKIPTFDCITKQWSYTDFDNQAQFSDYLDGLWNDECDYKFDEDSLYFNQTGRFFTENGYYTDLPKKTKERKEFWKTEGEKCVRGVIYKGRNSEWYLTREYYMMLNYLLISNKEKGDTDTFVDIRDAQYHLALYEKRAEVHNKHSLLVKKRQMASSLFHCAKVLNKYWFDRNSICKIFASDNTFINTEDGIWKFFNKYRDFLNEYTDWYRASLPDEEFSWMQRREVKIDGQKFYKGRKSVISGISLKVSAQKGVGGTCTYGYHEEAGIAPKLDATYRFFKPAVESGIYTTGMFIAAGSVGDLKDCIPLKGYMYSPTANGFLAVTSTWVTKERVPTQVGLYIPEHWGMPGFIDEYGNSKVMEAYEYLRKKYRDMKADPKVSPQDYQREISQKPIFLDDAFRHRDVSYFPVVLLENQQERIDLKNRENKWLFKPQKGLLEEKDGKIILRHTDVGPEHQYPIKPEWPDKRGVVTIYEPPEENNEFYTYFAGVDTIEADETTTSDSVFSMDIFKTAIEVEYLDKKDGKIKRRIEGDKLVATYRGRFDSADKTNEQGWLLLKKYNAFAFVERSKPNFINYMMKMGRAERYLAKESDVPMFRDLNVDKGTTKSKFGFIISAHNEMWKYLKSYAKEYILAEYGYIYKANSEEVIKVIRGVDKMDDFWLCEELIQFNEGGNFDRVVSFAAAVMIAKIYQQNRIIKRRSEVDKPKQREYIVPKVYDLLGGKTKKTNSKNKSRSFI